MKNGCQIKTIENIQEEELQEEAELPAKYKTDKELFLNCPPYPRLINDVADESQPEKELVLSADRRVNPRSLYVKVNNRIFAIDISAKGEKGND